MLWKVPRMWEGGQCVIIGGGSSVIRQFQIPQGVVDGVFKGKYTPEAYSPYLELLHKQHIIAVNMAYQIGDWVDVVFFGDANFFNLQKVGLLQSDSLLVTCTPECKKYQRIKYIAKNDKKTEGITIDPLQLSWNQNSGAAAINIAVHTGAKRIILLGFDMDLDANKNQHWHKFYKGNLTTIRSTFRKHLAGFPAIARDAKQLGVEIINANPDSKIECFPRMNFNEIVL